MNIREVLSPERESLPPRESCLVRDDRVGSRYHHDHVVRASKPPAECNHFSLSSWIGQNVPRALNSTLSQVARFEISYRFLHFAAAARAANSLRTCCISSRA